MDSNKYLKVKLGLIGLILVSLPYHYFISSILIVIGVVLTIFRMYSLKQYGLSKIESLSTVFICFFFLEVLGLTYTEWANVKVGLFTIEKHQALLFMPFIFLDVNISSQQRSNLLLAFVISCLIGSLMCIAVNISLSLKEYHMMFHPWIFSHDRFSEPLRIQAVYFALYLSLCVLILLDFFLRGNRKLSIHKKLFFSFLLAFFLVVIIQLGARTATVALVVTVMINLVHFGKSKNSWRMILVAVLVPVLFVALIFLSPIVKTRFVDMFKTTYEASNYGSYFARSEIWIPGLEVISENILVGVGTGDQQTELDKKFIKYNNTLGIQFFNMHNQYLQMLLGYGLVGLFIFLVILSLQVRKSLRSNDFLYLSFLILFCCACLTESILERNKGIIFFAVVSFIFWKSEPDHKVNG